MQKELLENRANAQYMAPGLCFRRRQGIEDTFFDARVEAILLPNDPSGVRTQGLGRVAFQGLVERESRKSGAELRAVSREDRL